MVEKRQRARGWWFNRVVMSGCVCECHWTDMNKISTTNCCGMCLLPLWKVRGRGYGARSGVEGRPKGGACSLRGKYIKKHSCSGFMGELFKF